MSNVHADSGDDTAITTTTTTTGAPRPKDTGKDAAAPPRTAQKRRRDRARDAAEQTGAGRAAAGNAEAGHAREVGAGETFVAWSGDDGGGPAGRQLLLIGLDGATPELAIGAWRTELRTIEMLTNRGLRGRLRSSTPWSSVPAWQSLLTGQDPGRLGIYGAERRVNHSYAAPLPIDSQAVRAARIWDVLGRAGHTVGVVGAPATTPAPRVQGHLIADRLGDAALATYPPALARQVALWLADDPPAAPATGDEIDRIVGQAYARTEQRFRLARRLLARNSYNCFVLCDDGIAQVQRALWHTLDVTHQRYSSGHPFAGLISAFYRFVDDQIGELLEYVGDDTVVAIGSAAGAQALDGELALNDWLIAEGELRLLEEPARPTPLAECAVDWANTRAWAGDSGAIYLNLAGREPQGAVAPDQAEPLLASLAARLRELAPPGQTAPAAGAALEVYRPSQLYSLVEGVAPDLLVVPQLPGWRTTALAGHGTSWLSTNTFELDSACESPDGFLILYDPLDPGGGRELAGATVYDVTPTLLSLFAEPAPARSRGRVLLAS
jgi:predicted AlkP superfamily phosphohydrolase/phosphomutase